MFFHYYLPFPNFLPSFDFIGVIGHIELRELEWVDYRFSAKVWRCNLNTWRRIVYLRTGIPYCSRTNRGRGCCCSWHFVHRTWKYLHTRLCLERNLRLDLNFDPNCLSNETTEGTNRQGKKLLRLLSGFCRKRYPESKKYGAKKVERKRYDLSKHFL